MLRNGDIVERPRNTKAVVGSNKEVSSLAGVERRRDTWDNYVENLEEDVTELRISRIPEGL